VKRNSEGVQRLLSVLARHADLVAEAFAGPVIGGDKVRDSALQELMQAGALKPYDEGTYYLSGALHDYFSVSLASFHAFQTLTRIDGQLRQADSQWEELLLLKGSGAARDVARLQIALERTIIDVGDVVERNIQLLNTMVLGHYGNVDSFASKLRQNRFYAREVQSCLRELEKLDGFIERMADGARVAGQPRIRQLLRRRLGAQLFNWTSRLKDAQSVISRRLFEARLLEQRLRQLARYASWLSSNRTATGFDIDLPQDAGALDPALLRSEPVRVRPQPDVTDPTGENLIRLIAIASRLKAAPRRQVIDEAEQDSRVLGEQMEEVSSELAPHQLALNRLLHQLRIEAHPLSLVQWKVDSAELEGVPDEHWLLYASVQLRGQSVPLQFVEDGTAQIEPFPINKVFHDVHAGPISNGSA
jgi:hypothetical protein